MAVSGRRPWVASLVRAAIVVGAGIALSVTVNPLLGRRVHWDWTAGLALVLFILLTLASRQKRV